MLSPALNAFKQRYPEAAIDVVVQSPGEELLRLNPNVNRVITFNQGRWYNFNRQFKFINQIRQTKYDLVVDFLGNPRSGHYTFLSGAPKRLGYENAQYTYAYNIKNKRIHGYSAISKIEFLSVLDVRSKDFKLEIYLDDNIEPPSEFMRLAGKKMVAISPVSLLEKKVWPTENFAAIVSRLSDEFGLFPVVIAGPNEHRFLDDYSKYSKCDYLPLYIDSIMALGHVLRGCRLFVGNDNGPKHIAAALGLPTYTVYGHSSDPDCWNYPDDPRHKYIGGMNKPDCMPIANIRVDTVWNDIKEFVDSLNL